MSSVDFSASFYFLLLPRFSSSSSSSSASFMWMDRYWGRKCGLLLDTQKHDCFRKHSHLKDCLFQYFTPLQSHPSHLPCSIFYLFSSPSERDTGQSAVHSSLGKISQPLPSQPRQPQPTPGKTRIYTSTHTHTRITFSDNKSITDSFYVLRKRTKLWLSIGQLHLRVTRIWRNHNIPTSLVSQIGAGRWPLTSHSADLGFWELQARVRIL